MATIRLHRPVQVETWRQEEGCGTFRIGRRTVWVNAENIQPVQPKGCQLFRAILTDVVILAGQPGLSEASPLGKRYRGHLA